ncbi:MAG: hypothetical protein ACFE9A_21155, partial [Candidatus Hodarchaeota archaeon]
LAKYEKSKKQPNWKRMEIYVRKGIATSNNERITSTLKEYKKVIKQEKKRKTGHIISFDPDRKFGIIKSRNMSCIFFPNCLTWYCKDISALINKKVSFIPIQQKTTRRSKNFKATQIKLVKTNK